MNQVWVGKEWSQDTTELKKKFLRRIVGAPLQQTLSFWNSRYRCMYVAHSVIPTPLLSIREMENDLHRLCVENQGSGSYPHCLKIRSSILFLGPLLCHSSQISSLTFLLPSPRFVKIRLDRERMASGLMWACPNTGLGARASETSGISSHKSSNGSAGW